MHSDPLISVITACYNGSAYLETSVRSAIDNHPSTEVIVVDDGSTDDSLARASSLARQYPGRVLVISQANQGPAGARNTGIRLARGKYLCFLDADDQYAPGFLHAAVDVLERDPKAVGVSCRIELVDAHRPVEPWQLEAMENSGPCNVVMRTETVRLIGGFPIDPAFRGKAGGEDGCFRKALLQFGPVPRLEYPFFRYRMSPGGYVNLFLDRATLVDGKVQLAYLTREEEDGSIRQATQRYQREVTSRALARLTETLHQSAAAVAESQRLAPALATIPGEAGAVECHALHWLARNWPIDGAIVALAPTDDRLLYAMASAGCGIVTVVGSLAANIQPLVRLGLNQAVAALPEPPGEAAGHWKGRLRLLHFSPRTTPEQTHEVFSAWSAHVSRFGLLVVPAALALPTTSDRWPEIFATQTLRVLQKP